MYRIKIIEATPGHDYLSPTGDEQAAIKLGRVYLKEYPRNNVILQMRIGEEWVNLRLVAEMLDGRSRR
jgi:hypothetical protein